MALREYLVDEVALDCEDGLLSRREALRRLGLLGVTGAAAAALLAACGDDDDTSSATSAAASATTPRQRRRSPTSTTGTTGASCLRAGRHTPSSAAPGWPKRSASTARTASSSGCWPTRSAAGRGARHPREPGLTHHIRSIPPRLAADGYTALAIDLLSAEGGTASLPSEGDATAALGNAPAERLIADIRAGLDELGRRAPGAKLAAIGFCFGGGMTWQLLAAGEPRLAAAVPFYGPFPTGADFAGSPNAAVLGVYAGEDSR